jgi:outer membrane protein assembly factor BamB
LDLEAQKKLLFEIHPDQPPWGEGWALEGPPVADGQHLFVALRRRDNLRAQAHVACFDAKRGRLRWRKFIAGADTVGQGRLVEYTHNLLTLDQGVLYYNTNLGAVAALRAEDGQIQWITRYPRMPASAPQPGRSLRHLLRDLTPCLVSQGIVFVAPADCDRLFALDAATGTLRWTTEEQTASDLVHLLGVGQGQLLASGSRLWWLDVETGLSPLASPAASKTICVLTAEVCWQEMRYTGPHATGFTCLPKPALSPRGSRSISHRSD